MFLKRVLVILCALFASSISFAQLSNAVIFVRPETISRAIKPESYNHSLWIQWPIATTPLGSNRLLSIVTGEDWRLDRDPFVNGNVDTTFLQQLGVPDARNRWLGAMQTVLLTNGPSNEPELSILGAPPMSLQTFGATKGRDPLCFYAASSWDDVALVRSIVGGDVLVVSYPPPPGSTVSAAWFMGKNDIPANTSTGVSGLVSAKEIVRLVSQPSSYEWRPPTDVTAEDWMKTVVQTRLTHIIVLVVLALLAIGWAVRSVAIQSGGRLARLFLAMIPCVFIGMVLGGNFAKATGPTPWNILPTFSFFALTLGLLPAYLGMRALWPRSHPLFPVALIAAILLLWADPTFTVFSHVFTLTPQAVSPICLGVLVALLTATVSLCFQGGVWPRIFAACLLCTTMLLGVFTKQWWSFDTYLLIVPVIAVICGASVMRLYYLPLLVAWPFIYHRWNGHFAWDIAGLLVRYSDKDAINAAAQAQFLLSPLLLLTLVAFVACTLVCGSFFKHQVRKTLTETNNSRALFWAALAMACMGVREPILLPSALIVLIAGFVVLLFDAAGSI